MLAKDGNARGIGRVETVAGFRIPIGSQVVFVIVQADRGRLIKLNRAGDSLARIRQVVVLDRGEHFQVVHGREVQTARVLKDVSAKENAAVAGRLIRANRSHAAFDVEADFGRMPGPMRP